MKKPKVVAIIQARMASSRLPGKVLLPLGPDNKSVLWWMAARAGLAKLVDEVYIATTTLNSNDEIKCDKAKIYRYHGQEDDVIGRVLSCAEYAEADIICDITADCPMVDPRHIDRVLKSLLNGTGVYDYVSNDVIDRSWPDGLDIQVYWTKALKKCKEKYNPKQHCGWNIPQYRDFKCLHWAAPSGMHWPELGLTLDTYEDYKLLQILFYEFGKNPGFAVEDVIDFLRNNPHLLEINKSVQRKKPEEG